MNFGKEVPIMANDAKKTPVTVAKPVMPAATPVSPKTEAKKTAAKKAPAKKATEEKKTAEVKKAPAAKKTAAKKPDAKKTTAKKTTAKKSSVDSKVYIQFFGKQVTASDVLASCEADYKKDNKAAVKKIEVYVKPEDNAAYYVVNGEVEGKVSL